MCSFEGKIFWLWGHRGERKKYISSFVYFMFHEIGKLDGNFSVFFYFVVLLISSVNKWASFFNIYFIFILLLYSSSKHWIAVAVDFERLNNEMCGMKIDRSKTKIDFWGISILFKMWKWMWWDDGALGEDIWRWIEVRLKRVM